MLDHLRVTLKDKGGQTVLQPKSHEAVFKWSGTMFITGASSSQNLTNGSGFRQSGGTRRGDIAFSAMSLRAVRKNEAVLALALGFIHRKVGEPHEGLERGGIVRSH